MKLQLVVCLFLFSITSGCASKAEVPIPVVEFGQPAGGSHHNLLVLLRGLGGSVRDFEVYGIVDEVHKRNLPFDVVAPDAHFGYYRTETIEERLKQDVIDPARARGYRRIWLAGFSMGGLGSLFYLRRFGHDVDGVILCSPFLGWRPIRGELRRAGGVANWQAEDDDPHDWQYLIWTWIKEYQRGGGAGYPPIYLGYGDRDLLTGDGPEFLAQVLPPEQVFTVHGNHDNETFRRIWVGHLDRLEAELSSLP